MKKKVIESIVTLYNDIDSCIGDLVNARLKRDEKAEQKALFQMESLMVSALQELSFLRDYLRFVNRWEDVQRIVCIADALIDELGKKKIAKMGMEAYYTEILKRYEQ